MGELTRLGEILGGEKFREYLRKRLDGVSSHEVGPGLHSRHPPGCLGNADPMARDHHRDCVIADRWERSCEAGDCQYADPTAPKPNPHADCPGHRGTRSIRRGVRPDGTIGPLCFVAWKHCARRAKWGRQHETPTGPSRREPPPGRRLLPHDSRNPWDRDPGEEG